MSHALAVLLVDDDHELRTLVRRMLMSGGCTVADFGSALEALAHLDHHRVDLVVTDLDMPGMDGATLVAAIQGRGLACAIVMMSGQLPARCTERLAAVGAQPIHAVLGKPIARDHVIGMITSVRAARSAGG